VTINLSCAYKIKRWVN